MDSRTFIQSVAVSVIVVLVVVVGTMIYGMFKTPVNPETNSPQTPQTSNDLGPVQQQVLEDEPVKSKQSTPVTVDISNVKTASNPFVGKKDAPLTILYWFDYQCPFCKKMEQNVLGQLVRDYVESGKAKLIYKDYQFLGADSQTAGLAGRAVWELAPEKFFEWHKAMFENQDGENYAWGSRADILMLTKSLGIDSVKVGKLMTDKAQAYQNAMNADKAEGKALGIKGTPGTVVGKKLIVGVQSYVVFRTIADQAFLAQ